MNKNYLIIAASMIAATALTARDDLRLDRLFEEPSEKKEPLKPKTNKSERVKKQLIATQARIDEVIKSMEKNQKQQMALRKEGRDLASELQNLDQKRKEDLDAVEKLKNDLSTLQASRDKLQEKKNNLEQQIKGLQKAQKKYSYKEEASRVKEDEGMTSEEDDASVSSDEEKPSPLSRRKSTSDIKDKGISPERAKMIESVLKRRNSWSGDDSFSKARLPRG